jgi:hypothetical protein
MNSIISCSTWCGNFKYSQVIEGTLLATEAGILPPSAQRGINNTIAVGGYFLIHRITNRFVAAIVDDFAAIATGYIVNLFLGLAPGLLGVRN